MEIVPDEMLQSGWQPRPQGAPSAGHALSVLVAVCAVLWVWNMDWWPLQEAPKYRLVAQVLYSYWTCALLVLGSNYSVFRWATRPLWKSTRPDTTSTLVLLLCLVFHAAWVLLLGFIGLLAVAFSGSSEGLFQGL
ncbi:hypothetical protein [Hymenobacter sediminicola]|uniref:Uncharacterized protein n=1 Tax=Hymenobacter sediminicola TaxID=2761579 RepID=A0A7G7W9V1_9BACT|nr:hypothetical protein [Hymenobacter sediminicola]QNH63144.1 hypothetical protein H4317_04860 [Hymenobacter sediminicola]